MRGEWAPHWKSGSEWGLVKERGTTYGKVDAVKELRPRITGAGNWMTEWESTRKVGRRRVLTSVRVMCRSVDVWRLSQFAMLTIQWDKNREEGWENRRKSAENRWKYSVVAWCRINGEYLTNMLKETMVSYLGWASVWVGSRGLKRVRLSWQMYTVSIVDLELSIKATQSRKLASTSKVLVYVTRTEGT